MICDLRTIPALYINLPQHTDRNQQMLHLLRQCGFQKITRIEGVSRPDNPVAGCSAAHHRALTTQSPPFIVFEDDCAVKSFAPIIDVPDDADAVYLGISSWGRMNGHSGPYVRSQPMSDTLYRVHNMLGAHAVLYWTDEYVRMCQRVAYHAAYLIEDYQDIGFAEIQRWFNVYAYDDPFFYQTSSQGTDQPLTSYPVEVSLDYNPTYFRPQKLAKDI